LGALADLIADEIGDDALVVPATLREELEALVVRCRLREQFSDSLGPSIKARYRPSVRALFVGPSGTGKTLAAAWLATRLGIPLCRVDLSAVTSKYIGETEKNLSQLLSRAEQTEVVLLFDEADALFGKRTDIREANDRFANAQTNYLLQRMESYDGITVLTSNSRARFDVAFTRRFDAIITFPSPTPQERRALWSTHLGEKHDVSVAHLDLLAVAVDFSGGQIRNAVLGAAVAAAQEGQPLQYRHVLTGVATEYRKISRQLPDELKQNVFAGQTQGT
jgi:SpoVK/Ycf46/Vps4 family AAA+-type ATPase